MTTRKDLIRRIIAPLLAAAMVVSVRAYEFAKPANAASLAPAPAAPALDSNSVGALLSLDQAMEALASRVTPAIVNVTVTSKTNLKINADEDGGGAPDMQQFGPFGNPFGGQFGGRQQPRVEHCLGSGVIISPDGYIVTNNHVVDSSTAISVTMSDRRILPAKPVGTDPPTGLAWIQS